jgi:beta-lactamase superfamily II metal-dependent hydrolase
VGADNHLGHPCDELLERLSDLPVYRTDEHGAVEVVSDGTQVWVETEDNGEIPARSTASPSP